MQENPTVERTLGEKTIWLHFLCSSRDDLKYMSTLTTGSEMLIGWLAGRGLVKNKLKTLKIRKWWEKLSIIDFLD